VTSGEFQITPGQKHETGRQFTTREAIAEELSTIKQMQQGRQTTEPIMRQEAAAAHARSREFLNPAQQRAIEEVLTSQDRIHGLQGLAGSGKTSALSSIREGAEQNGYAVEGFAPPAAQPANSAMRAFQPTPCKVSLRVEASNGTLEDPNARHLYMLDESSLTSTARCDPSSKRSARRPRIAYRCTRQHQA